MGLSICYECPQCHRAYDRDLTQLGPGKTPKCTTCETIAELTSQGLKQFETALEEYCRS